MSYRVIDCINIASGLFYTTRSFRIDWPSYYRDPQEEVHFDQRFKITFLNRSTELSLW